MKRIALLLGIVGFTSHLAYADNCTLVELKALDQKGKFSGAPIGVLGPGPEGQRPLLFFSEVPLPWGKIVQASYVENEDAKQIIRGNLPCSQELHFVVETFDSFTNEGAYLQTDVRVYLACATGDQPSEGPLYPVAGGTCQHSPKESRPAADSGS